MSVSLSKTKSISGAALLGALLVGCGGGGGGGTSGSSSNLTQGSTQCAATTGSISVDAAGTAVLGSCEQYENSINPTKVATAFKSPGFDNPVVFNTTSSTYTINLPLVAGSTVLTQGDKLVLAGGSQALSFGNFAGSTFQQVTDRTTGGATTAYDFAKTVDSIGAPYLDLNFSRFGVFSRFQDRTLGYYGGWANGVSSNATLPTGSVTYRGAVVGVFGPGASNNSAATAVGFSSLISITVNFAAPGAPVTAVSVTGFNFSQNGGFASVVGLSPGGTLGTSSLDTSNPIVKKLAATFSTPNSATTSGLATVKLDGSFYGAASPAPVTELVGSIRFVTADGRNGIGSFGVRSGATIVGAP
jgi:hypothetical protein